MRPLVARAAALHHSGQSSAAIAETLNQEGFRPAKRRETFNAQMVRHLLTKAAIVKPGPRRRQPQIDRAADEWTIRELAETIGMPEPTLYTWVQQGRLSCRRLPSPSGRAHRKLIHADAETIAALKAVRATPSPWRRLPAPRTTES